MTITDPTTAPTDWATTAGALADRFALTAAENDRTGVLPKENFDALREAGITAALVPTEFGGGGASFAEMCGILRTLARGCPATAVTLSMHTHLVAAAVWRQLHGVDASPLLRRVAGDRVILVSTGASDWLLGPFNYFAGHLFLPSGIRAGPRCPAAPTEANCHGR